MKNLKIQFGLFSLLAVLAVSVFLTSCEQEDIIPTNEIELLTQPNPQEGSIGIILPNAITYQGKEAVETYLENATPEELTKHANDYATLEFLNNIGIPELLFNEFQETGSFQGIDLSKHLSAENIAVLNTQLTAFESGQINSRYWVTVSYCCGWQNICTGQLWWRTCQRVCTAGWHTYQIWVT